MDIVVYRRRLSAAMLAVVVAIAFAVWWVQPDRSLERSWGGLIDAVEAQRPAAIRSRLAADYADRWSYDRESLVRDARLAFFHFQELELMTHDVEIVRDGSRATIRAIIRLRADGSERAGEARLSVNALYSPFSFEWERDAGFPWSWKLKSFDHAELDLAELDLARFRRGSLIPY